MENTEMRFGVCASMITRDADAGCTDVIDRIASAGYDYVELPLARLAMMSSERFSAVRKAIKNAGFRCECCNDFFPPSIRLTGESVHRELIRDYVEAALERAAILGVSVVVFGSAGARSLPSGFPHKEGWRQLSDLLTSLNDLAKVFNVTIAIEALCSAECNLVNRHAESLSLVQTLNLPRICLLLDSYHLTQAQESFSIIQDIASRLEHVHFAHQSGRVFPKLKSAEYEPLFKQLHAIGYCKRISIEAYSQDLPGDLVNGLKILRNLDRSCSQFIRASDEYGQSGQSETHGF